MTRGACFQPLFPKGLPRGESFVQPRRGGGDEDAGKLFLAEAFPQKTSPEMHDLTIHIYYWDTWIVGFLDSVLQNL